MAVKDLWSLAEIVLNPRHWRSWKRVLKLTLLALALTVVAALFYSWTASQVVIIASAIVFLTLVLLMWHAVPPFFWRSDTAGILIIAASKDSDYEGANNLLAQVRQELFKSGKESKFAVKVWNASGEHVSAEYAEYLCVFTGARVVLLGAFRSEPHDGELMSGFINVSFCLFANPKDIEQLRALADATNTLEGTPIKLQYREGDKFFGELRVAASVAQVCSFLSAISISLSGRSDAAFRLLLDLADGLKGAAKGSHNARFLALVSNWIRFQGSRMAAEVYSRQILPRLFQGDGRELRPAIEEISEILIKIESQGGKSEVLLNWRAILAFTNREHRKAETLVDKAIANYNRPCASILSKAFLAAFHGRALEAFQLYLELDRGRRDAGACFQALEFLDSVYRDSPTKRDLLLGQGMINLLVVDGDLGRGQLASYVATLGKSPESRRLKSLIENLLKEKAGRAP